MISPRVEGGAHAGGVPRAHAASLAPGAREARSPGLAILLVEDSPVLAERLCEALEAMPEVQHVRTVDREAAAIEAFGPWDVLVLDLHLKQGTGFGVLRALRRQPELQPVVIVLTNHDVPGYRRRAEACGVHHFLDKARDFETLGEVLRDAYAARYSRPA